MNYETQHQRFLRETRKQRFEREETELLQKKLLLTGFIFALFLFVIIKSLSLGGASM